MGTAITTLVRKADHAPAETIGFRHLWGRAKREDLLETAETDPNVLYDTIEPVLPLGLPLVRTAVSEEYFDWPTLPDLFPVSFPGVNTARDGFLVDIDLSRLKARLSDYFNTDLSHDEIARRYPSAMKTIARLDVRMVRETLLTRGGPDEAGFVRLAYRPFDNRWLYWEADTYLLDRPRPDYKPHIFDGNMWLGANKREIQDFSHGTLIHHIGGWKLGNWGIHFFPLCLREDSMEIGKSSTRRPNLSSAARRYLDRLDLGVEDLFHHILAVLHDPAYREANADALRMDWPRIPLPGWPDGDASEAVETLARSAARGRELAALLDPETPVSGVTTGTLRPEVAAIAVPATVDGRNMTGDDFALTAGWGHYGTGDAVMPGQGRVVERAYTPDERAALGDAISVLGQTTFDIYLNGNAYWRNVPANVWRYKLGGYQVLKKWLSYRERGVLGRALLPEEVGYFAEVARRIGAMLMETDTPAVSDYACG